MKPTKIVTMIALLLAMGSCQKEESTQPATSNVKPSPTKEEMLTGKTWILSAMTCDPAYMGKTDLYYMIEDCERDNTMKFSAGSSKTLLIDEGGMLCSGHDQQASTSWDMDAAGTTLTINQSPFSLKSLSSDGFQLAHSMNVSGTDYTITETYIAK